SFSFPQVSYNNVHIPNTPSPFNYFQVVPQVPVIVPPVTAVAPPIAPSPSSRRKRKNTTPGQGGSRKRRKAPAPAANTTSAICGVGPVISTPSDDNPPTYSSVIKVL